MKSDHKATMQLRLLAVNFLNSTRSVRFGIVATAVLMTVAAGLNAAAPFLFSRSVDAFAVSTANKSGTYFLFASIGAIFFVKVIAEARWFIYEPAANAWILSIRGQYLRQVINLKMADRGSRSVSTLNAISGRAINSLEELIESLLFVAIPVTFEVIIISIIVTINMSIVLSLVLIATLVVYFSLLIYTSEQSSKLQSPAIDSLTNLQRMIGDFILNSYSIKMSGVEYNADLQVRNEIKKTRDKHDIFYRSRGIFGFVLIIALILGYASVMTISLIDLQRNTISIGEFVLVNVYVLQLIRPVEGLSFAYRRARHAFSLVVEFLDIMILPTEDMEKGTDDLLSSGPICFDSIHFKRGSRKGGLSGLTFCVPKDRITVLVGPSGSGKSTIVQMLLKTVEPTAGHILIGDQDLSDINTKSLRSRIGFMPQDVSLFEGSLLYNITFGLSYDDKCIDEVLEKTALSDFVNDLPEGLDTSVGERGLLVSGGERQRLALARALIRKPDILVLDEPTSALDDRSTAKILEQIKAAVSGTTTLIVSHDRRVIDIADHVVDIQSS